MALLNPRKKKADDIAALPPVAPTPPKPQRPQTFQGARQLTALGGAGRRLLTNPNAGAAITDTTPQSEIQRRVGNAAWNASFGATPGDGVQYADSPGGSRTFHSLENPVLRPTSGPQSAASVGLATRLAPQAGQPIVQPQHPQLGLARPGQAPADASTAGGAGTGTLPVAPVIRPVAAATAPTGTAIAEGGRRINGVDTFSDGQGAIPQTITPAQVQAAGNRVNIADAGALANPLASDALGGATPTQQQMVAQDVANTPQAPRLVNPVLQQMFADSRANEIASGDIRSAAGTVANNLKIDATSGTPRQRRIAEHALAQLQQGAQQRATTAAEQAGATQRAGMTEAGQNARTAATQAGATQRALLTRPAGSPVTLADGTLGVLNSRTAKVATATTASGKPAKMARTKLSAAEQRTQSIIDGLHKASQTQLAAITKQQLPGPDGTIAPVSKGTLRHIKAQQAQLMGLHPQVNPKTGEMIGYVNGQWMPL